MIRFEKKKDSNKFELEIDENELYECNLYICSKPQCKCTEIQVSAKPLSQSAIKDWNGMKIGFMLDVDEKKLSKSTIEKSSGPAKAFGRNVCNELSSKQWKMIRNLFYSVKYSGTKKIDPKKEIIDFSYEEVENKSMMVCRNEVLPWTEPQIIQLENKKYFMEEQYCVKPGCTCKDVYLSIYPYIEVAAPNGKEIALKEEFVFFVNHEKRIFNDNLKGEKPKGKALQMLEAVLKKYPDLLSELKTRQDFLQQLYKTSRKANYKPEVKQTQATLRKVGRNSPCSCGSGKKFKKCCG